MPETRAVRRLQNTTEAICMELQQLSSHQCDQSSTPNCSDSVFSDERPSVKMNSKLQTPGECTSTRNGKSKEGALMFETGFIVFSNECKLHFRKYLHLMKNDKRWDEKFRMRNFVKSHNLDPNKQFIQVFLKSNTRINSLSMGELFRTSPSIKNTNIGHFSHGMSELYSPIVKRVICHCCSSLFIGHRLLISKQQPSSSHQSLVVVVIDSLRPLPVCALNILLMASLASGLFRFNPPRKSGGIVGSGKPSEPWPNEFTTNPPNVMSSFGVQMMKNKKENSLDYTLRDRFV